MSLSFKNLPSACSTSKQKIRKIPKTMFCSVVFRGWIFACFSYHGSGDPSADLYLLKHQNEMLNYYLCNWLDENCFKASTENVYLKPVGYLNCVCFVMITLLLYSCYFPYFTMYKIIFWKCTLNCEHSNNMDFEAFTEMWFIFSNIKNLWFKFYLIQ